MKDVHVCVPCTMYLMVHLVLATRKYILFCQQKQNYASSVRKKGEHTTKYCTSYILSELIRYHFSLRSPPHNRTVMMMKEAMKKKKKKM